MLDERLRLRCICLAALAALSFNDRNARLLVQANAMYAMSSLLLSHSCRAAGSTSPNASQSLNSSSTICSTISSSSSSTSAGPSA